MYDYQNKKGDIKISPPIKLFFLLAGERSSSADNL